MGSGHFSYSQNASTPRYLLIIYRVYRVYHVSFYSHFVQNIQSFIIKKYSLYIVGEVRGDETVDMISSAMLNGHSGSMSTGHSNNPADMLHRIETMMMMGIDLPLVAIQRQVASAIDIIIHLGRLRDKTRKLLAIVEVLGFEEGKIQMQTLYEFREEGCKNEKVQGAIVKVEELVHRDKLLAAGYPA